MYLVTLVFLLLSVGINTIDVWRNIQWTVHNQNGSIYIPARVPGGIYSDLRNAGIIDDILYRFNDVLTRWVAHDTWTYTGKLMVTESQLQRRVAKLVLEGVDTVAFIELNDSPIIGITDNMFVRYAFDVKPYLKIGENILKITFSSPINAAQTRSSSHFTAPECVPNVYHGECHVNQLRKMQASFSWDWGPAFPSVGIWKPVYLRFYDGAIISLATVYMKNYQDNHWALDIKVYLETSVGTKNWMGLAKAELYLDGNQRISIAKDRNVTIAADGTGELSLNLRVSGHAVSLWWPNGYGPQPLYDLRVSISQFNDKFTKLMRVGFKTLELVERNASEIFEGNTAAGKGLTFYFKINGYPLFMKGSNWIPAHILPEFSGYKTTVDKLLHAAQDAHMSMLRVWGGGIYESDYFYRKCDELGILIWQDLMFACAMYPADKDFLDTVRTEIDYNVKRLQYHTSIAVWAGNNENEVALRGNWYDTQPQFDRYKRDYVKLYVDTIGPIVRDLDPMRRYLVSSPSNGLESEREGYIANNPYDPHYGDTHYYNYLDDNWNQNIYPKTRFASEYGFQSMPSLATMRTATKNIEDFSISSEYSKHRQHSPNGYETIRNQIEKHFRWHKDEENHFENFVFYSQISQAMAIKAETEFYRQSQEDWFTMGALYWQLNDVWQAPSWSGIEFGGKWKMLHYFAKTFFAPVIVSARLLSTRDVEVYLINDRFVPIITGEILAQYYIFTSLTPVKEETFPAYAAPLSAKIQTVIPLWHEEAMPDFIKFTLKAPGVVDSSRNFIFPKPLKQIALSPTPNIRITVTQGGTPRKLDEYIVNIEVDTPVLFLWLESTVDGHFEDNGLIITTSSTKVNFLSKQEVSPLDLKRSITYQYVGNI